MRRGAPLVLAALLAACGGDDQPPFEAIELQRRSFPDSAWPDQTITLRADGTATRLRGGDEAVGTFHPGDFAKLCRLLEETGSTDHSRRFDPPGQVFHSTVTTLRIWPAGDRDPVEIVETAYDAAPFEVWAIQRAIEGTVSEVRWSRASLLGPR